MTDVSQTHPTSSGTETSHGPGGNHQPAVNVQKLAEKVYDLLLADARLGRARGDSLLRPQRTVEG
jgi:hypothetical protein